MQKLYSSRKQKQQDHAEKVPNLSPEKYGKGAYYELTYTPSKLADHVLYRQASNLKKIQEEISKSRQFQAQHNILADQVAFLKRQRDGLTKSQNDIIQMYKTILSEMQAKNEERVSAIQKKFKHQMQKFIQDKQQQAKFFQSQRQIFQERIQSLQNQVADTKNLLAQAHNQITILSKDLEAQQSQNKHLTQKFQQHVKKSNQDLQRAKQQLADLNKQFMMAQVQWKNTLNQQLHKKDKQIDNLQRTHRIQLEKAEEIRKNQAFLKNQQIVQLTRSFQAQISRLSELVNIKDRTIDHLGVELNKQKTRSINLSRQLQHQTGKARFENGKLSDQVSYLSKQNEILAKDKIYLSEDLDKENANLRQLLFESSNELDRCKIEIMDLAKQNSALLLRLKGAQDESRTWRDSYYLNKSRPY